MKQNDANSILNTVTIKILKHFLVEALLSQTYQKVKYAQPKQLEDQTHMSPIIEPAKHLST